MEEEAKNSSLKDQQKLKLKDLGLDKSIVEEVAGMWVLEAPVYLMDTRVENGYCKCKIRVVLGNDIDLPYKPERSANQYPFPVDAPTLALTEVVNTALVRMMGIRGYVASQEKETNKVMQQIIDRSKDVSGLTSVTLVTVEGSIWEGQHTFQPNPSISFYTNQLLEKLKTDYPIEKKPLILLAACNQKDTDGQTTYATITPPKGVDLVYTQGLASIYYGNGHVQYIEG